MYSIWIIFLGAFLNFKCFLWTYWRQLFSSFPISAGPVILVHLHQKTSWYFKYCYNLNHNILVKFWQGRDTLIVVNYFLHMLFIFRGHFRETREVSLFSNDRYEVSHGSGFTVKFCMCSKIFENLIDTESSVWNTSIKFSGGFALLAFDSIYATSCMKIGHTCWILSKSASY